MKFESRNFQSPVLEPEPFFGARMVLPQEILDRFVDELGAEEPRRLHRTALRSCLFVSHSFRQRALISLCSVVLIAPNSLKDAPKKLSSLRQVISPTPGTRLLGIGRYIKKIAFMFSLQGSRSSIFTEAAGLLSREDLTVILNALHGEDYGIETLNFHLVSHEIWPDGIASITKPILSLIASPFLRSLAITHFKNIPVNFIDDTQITRLSLKGVNFKQATAIAQGRRPPIKTFSSNSRIPDSFNDTPSNSLFRELKSFSIVCETADHFTNARQILAAASQTVTHVDLSAYSPVTYDELFDLSLLPNLASLDLADGTSTSSVFPHNGHQSISFLTAMLDVQRLVANLAKLTLLVHLSGDAFNDTDFSNILTSEPHSEWERLDRILTGSHYPSLTYLKLSFFFEVRFQATDQVPEPGQDFDEDTFNDLGTARVKELFPRLSKHSQIAVTVDVGCWKNISR